MKNAITKSSKKKSLLVSAMPPTADMEPAARINHWHEIVKQAGQMSVAAALNAGMELFKAKLDHPGTFEKWIESNCEFDRRTAYRYLSLVQQALSADDLPKLANGSDKQREKAIDEYAAQTDSKTLTELYADFGIIKKTPSKMGGKREGAGRKRKDAAEEEAKALDEAANSPALLYAAIKEPIETVYRLFKEKDIWARLDIEDLATVQGILQVLYKTSTAALAERSK